MSKLIVFDCDSTLSSIEGVDELARLKGETVFREVAALTNQAMDGCIALEEVFRRRMELIRPDQADMDQVAQRYCQTLAAGVQELMRELQASGWTIVVVSGGLYPPVKALAEVLGIQEVMAVPVQFDTAGHYQDFDDQYHTARSGGKPVCIAELKARFQPQITIMVGDGVSDLETQPGVEHFIGYGEFVIRDRVKQEAEYFAMSMREVSGIIQRVAA
ncbi:MAG: HAD-IB family phosphatase [Verrucomicrobiota bacterium]